MPYSYRKYKQEVKDWAYANFDETARILDAGAGSVPSVMEIGGCAEIDNSELDNYVTKSTLSSISKHLDEKFLYDFGKDTSCHVNVYFIENGRAVMIDTWKKN